MGDVIERANVVFFEAFTEKFRGDVAGFAVGEVAIALGAERDESGVQQADDMGFAVDEKFGVDGISVAGGDAVPHVGKAAGVFVAGEAGFHFKFADELAHGSGVGEYWACDWHFSFFQRLNTTNPILVEQPRIC
jgi:hypothetical protein